MAETSFCLFLKLKQFVIKSQNYRFFCFYQCECIAYERGVKYCLVIHIVNINPNTPIFREKVILVTFEKQPVYYVVIGPDSTGHMFHFVN